MERLYRYVHSELDPPTSLYYSIPKIAIKDIDNSVHPLGTPTLFSLTCDGLEENSKFKLRRSEIMASIAKAVRTADLKYLDEAAQMIVDCKLKKSLIYRACKIAAMEFRFIRDIHPAVRILRDDMNYTICIMSGSFYPAVYYLTQRFAEDLNVQCYGSKLYFDEFGILKKIDILVGPRKAEIDRKLMPKFKFGMIVTDDPILDKQHIEASIEHNFPSLLIGKKDSLINPSPLIMEALNLRTNAMEFLRYAKIFEYSLVVSSFQEESFSYVETARKLIKQILETDDTDKAVDYTITLYKMRRDRFNVEDLYNCALGVRYGFRDLKELKELISKRFIEAKLDEKWRV
jgi:hypothetical protein